MSCFDAIYKSLPVLLLLYLLSPEVKDDSSICASDSGCESSDSNSDSGSDSSGTSTSSTSTESPDSGVTSSVTSILHVIVCPFTDFIVIILFPTLSAVTNFDSSEAQKLLQFVVLTSLYFYGACFLVYFFVFVFCF